jgi:hypothetical protein
MLPRTDVSTRKTHSTPKVAQEPAESNVGVDEVASQQAAPTPAPTYVPRDHWAGRGPEDRADIVGPERMKNFHKSRAAIFHTAANTFADVSMPEILALENVLHHRGTPTMENAKDHVDTAAKVVMGLMDTAFKDLDAEVWTGRSDNLPNQKKLHERIGKLVNRLSNDPEFALAISEASARI